MWKTIILLLFSWICYSHCIITWNSPTDGHNEMVYENTTIGSEIVTLNATTTGSSAVTYTIMNQEQLVLDTFGIQNTNELYIKAELDYENTKSYTVQLRALDSSTDDTADVTVTVEVLDVNDAEPVVTSLPSVTLPTDTAIGALLFTVIATDEDTVGSLIYSIKSGNENQEFIINATTGEITLNGTFDIDNKEEYDLVLEVTDGVFTVEEQVTFYLTDVIWRSPINNQSASVPEGEESDNWNVTLDADNAVIYSLTQIPDGNEFRIRNNEELYVAETLDFETTQLYTINLKASALTGRTAEITYTVEVTDVNDQPLQFTPDVATVDLSKDTDIGTGVYTPTTIDPDTVGSPTFVITDGNTNDTFSINSTTGELSLETLLSASITEYNIVIQGTDGVYNATLSLTVTVNEVVWLEPEKGTVDEVPENIITVVKNLTAETAVSYFIISVTPDQSNFDIQTNQLVLTSALDYENTTEYTLVLKAVDSDGKSATVTYMVNVADANDDAPEFQSDEFLLIAENTPVDTSIYAAVTTDRDTVGTTTYSITGGDTDDTFAINSTSGVLSLSKALSPTTVGDLTYTLLIEADDSVHQVTQGLSVTVKTVPVLDLPENVTLSEIIDASGGLELLNLTSTDLDGDSTPVYSIHHQSHAGIFQLNGDDTKLLITTDLDYEDIKEYNVSIRVVDTSKFHLSSQTTVHVYVRNENDEKPNFTSEPAIDTADDTPTAVIIYNAETTDPDNIGTITYSIIDGDTNDDFSMAANGSITLNNALNASATLTYNLTLQANDTVNVRTFVLTVNLITEPQIDSPDPNITLDEGSYESHPVWTLSSTDIDNDPTPTYEIIDQSVDGTFNLSVSGDNPQLTQLTTSATFDYENTTSYTVILSVKDSSSLSRSSSATVTVYINNLNDAPPVFTSTAQLQIREDITGAVLNVTTTDPDSPSAVATYSITDGNTNSVFDIDPDNGSLILVVQPSTYDTLAYSLDILANDTVNTAKQMLNVSVVTAPTFVFPNYNLTVTENTNTTDGYVIWGFNSTDRDGDLNHTYAIVSQSDPGLFSISADGTELLMTATLDYENNKTSYNVTLRVTDSSSFAMSTDATLMVYLTDDNDNSPELQSNITFEMSEFTVVGAGVYTAITTDIDTQSTVTYAIIGGDTNNTFSINETSGEITLAEQLRPDVTLSYEFVLQANDSVQTLVFNVTGYVKTAPRFNITSNVTIPEDQDTSNTFSILVIESTDPDGDTGVFYEIIFQSVNFTFDISADNKHLTTNVTLDYETTPEYTIILRATDNSTFSLSSTIELTISIEDVNDISPIFTPEGEIDIPETLNTSTVFFIANATDIDTVGTVTYSITGGNDDGFFSIEPESGTLTLAKLFDESTRLVYNLSIQANDTVNTDTLNLTVNLKTVPVLDAMHINVSENGVDVIWNLTSTDFDGDTNPTYTILSQSDPDIFYINDIESAVVTNASFDFETRDTPYTFVVQVIDSSSLKLSSSATFTVSITDANDNKPEFNSSAELQLPENTPLNTVVYTAVATDVDGIGTIAYAIIGGNDENIFEIDEVSGNITLKQNLNASATLTHLLVLQANDSLNVNTLNVTFTLSTAPVLIIPDSVTVVENVNLATVVSTLNATDLDGDTNFTYELLSQSVPGTFRIESTNLVTNASIDHESVQKYSLSIRVSDTSDFTMTSTATLNVSVIDINDAMPTFISGNSTVAAENIKTGTLVYTAVASDDDTPAENITYTIIGGNAASYFNIDSLNGSVTLQTALEPETVDDLTKILTILANDSLNTDTMNLTIEIKTVPVLHIVNISLPEDTNTTDGYRVLTINSTDLDGDNNTFGINDQSVPGVFFINGNELFTSTPLNFETTRNYSIDINVTDPSVLSSVDTLYVYITDVNDNGPVFTSSNATVYVLQTADTGDVIYTASTDDLDTVGNVSYAIIGGNRNSDFSVGVYSGDVTIQNKLRPNNASEILYELWIEANDTVNAVTLTLPVRIRTVPYLNIIDQIIAENTNTTEVWVIEWVDFDGDQDPTLDIVSESVTGTFQIVNNSVLITNASFNYEMTTEYTATIRITDAYNLTSNDTITIYITDENDVTPEFKDITTVDLYEAAAAGTVFFVATAADNDKVGTVTYSIIGGNDDVFFGIDSDSGNVTLVKAFTANASLVYNLSIQANDTVNTGTLNLTVNVKTVPVLEPMYINISENGANVIWNLTSTDIDGDTNETYTILPDGDSDIFYIDYTESAVVTNASFDFETKFMYTFVVQVTDNSSLKLSSSATFTVYVINENDEKPEFNSSVEVQLSEFTDINTVVYTAIATDVDGIGNITYSIIGGNEENIFEIDEVSGNITLKQNLNASATLTHILLLQANDSLNVNTLNVTFTLSTAPVMRFPDLVTVMENVDIGTVVLTLNATDLDGDTNFTYELISQSGIFRIDGDKLLTNATIDYEATQKYTLGFRVTDPSYFTSSATLNVSVIDINDNKPVFTSGNSTVVAENIRKGTLVYTAVTSDDDDTQDNITYTIIGGNAGSYFYIDSFNGSVTLQTALEPSTVDDLTKTLTIQANDSVNTETLNLTIEILTVPVLHIVNISLPEDTNTTDGYRVWTINSTDLDGDSNTFTIVAQSEPGVFFINGSEVFTNTLLDFEATRNYSIVINVTDSSILALSSVDTVYVYVTDDNDNHPVFTSSNATVYVLQTADTEEVLYMATTDDLDTVGNVSYDITAGDDNNEFQIGQYSGELTLTKELNPQTASDLNYTLLIEANDTVNTASLNLPVRVRTVPYLNISDQNITENTDTTGPYEVWTIDWSDLDGDQNPTFDIVSESVTGIFRIINNSVLVTSALFDFENTTQYTATIRSEGLTHTKYGSTWLTLSKVPPGTVFSLRIKTRSCIVCWSTFYRAITDIYNLTSNDTITLYVNDANDVTPVFISNVTEKDLWEEAPTGEVVFTFSTEDPDTLGTPTYSITDGNTEAKFELDPASGNLTLIAALDFEMSSSYTLKITANDSINAANFNFTVNVKTSPVINFTGITVNISEDSSVPYSLLNLTSTDRDGDTPKYTVITESVNGTFVITGDQLSINASLDYEDVKNYTVTIQVTDSSLGLTSSDTLTVLVKDVNDIAPIFTPDTAELEIREDTSVGTVIFVAEASDADSVGELTYSIIGGNSNNDFSIDSISGNVTLNNTLDPSAKLSHSLVLQVNDGVLTDTLELTVNVKTAPEMDFPDYNVTIPEDTDTSENYTVLVLSSTDLDGDINPRYELVNQSVLGTFFISTDNSNSSLVTNSQFNYSDVNVYEVTIRVIDSSNFTMSSEETLTIYISDANNLNPVITSPLILEIPETLPTDTVIFTVTAVDSDTVGEISYDIIGGNTNGDFRIGSQSGNLTLVNPLQPSEVLEYILEIEANDSVNTAAVNLTVSVQTIPEIVLLDDTVTLREDLDTSGTYTVLELNSTDLDNDPDPVFNIKSQTVNDTFEIANGTLLVTTATFDFESVTSYEVVIQVKDTSAFNLSSSVTLTVSISDANNLAPVFTSPTEIYKAANTRTGTVVYEAKTYDNDTVGPAATYSIIGGNTGDGFSIDETTGAVTLENEFLPGAVLIYNLQLQANDSVNTGFLNLTVNVVTVPELLFPAKKIIIEENSDKSQDSLVWLCNSQDLDGDPNATYSIVNQTVDDVFELNADNTRLITTATFDYEERTSYTILIKVIDSSPLEQSSSASLTVYIGNVNDVVPEITSKPSVKILVNTEKGGFVYQALTEDPDGSVTFEIIGGNTNNDFTIDAISGNVTLVNDLNVTLTANYSLVIRANDTVNTANLTVFIDIVPDIDECETNPCENDASCIDGTGEYTCECKPGYNGTNCTIDIDECASDPCQNGATCQEGIDEYNCTCVDGFRGDNCEEDINECSSSPCENNGTCNDLTNAYNCTCVLGYEGFNCETEIDECDPDPCQNNATCNNLIGEYTCTCVDGYEGDNCTQDINECASVVCRNGANCLNLLNAFSCECPPGYTGTFCEQECPNNFHGDNCAEQCTCSTAGTVSCDHVNGTCYCNDYYEGDTCDTDINECNVTGICNGTNEGCDNSIGNYTCDCYTGYDRNASGDCVPDVVTTTPTTPLPVSRRRFRFKLVIDFVVPDFVNLQVRATYNKYENEIRIQLQIVFSRATIIILSIRRGSVITEYDVITDEDDASDVARAATDLATGEKKITIFNENASVTSLEVNNQTVAVGQPFTDGLACEIYEAADGRCTGDYVCAVRDGKPGCQLKDTEDNLPLILGLGIGVPSFFVGLAIVVLCIAYYNNKRKLLGKRYRRDKEDVGGEFYKMPVRANTGPPTWPFFNSPDHAEYTYNADYSSRDDSHRHGYAEEFNGQYDNQVERDSNNYTWDYLYSNSRPGEPFKIKRARLDH